MRFSTHERQQNWLAGIEGALKSFGGVPKELLFDNAKCLMIEHDTFIEGQHRWNSKLLSMAKDYSFKLRACCRPYRAKTKDKIAHFNGYLKNSFVVPLNESTKQVGLRLDDTIANAHVGSWLTAVAHQRVHGITVDKPQVRLDEERLQLMPPPITPHQKVIRIDESQPIDAIPIESFQHPLSLYYQLLGGVV